MRKSEIMRIASMIERHNDKAILYLGRLCESDDPKAVAVGEAIKDEGCYASINMKLVAEEALEAER